MSPSKYILTAPDDLHPYVPVNESHQNPEYPDFEPWKHTKEEDQILLNFVAKGFYTTSKVNFESISARSSLQESLPKLSDQLADQFSRVLRIREEEINRIPATDGRSQPSFNELCGPGFLLPSRVTLTEHRRELWLQELGSSFASLPKLSKHIPHGLKRRQVLEQCCAKQIPLKRAIWLIKCCYSMEWKIKTSKSKDSEDGRTLQPLLTKEWTDNFVYILEKLIFEMVQYDSDPAQLKRWRAEVGYFLKLLGNCYTLELIDKEVFHHWLVEFGAKVKNFEFLPLTLHILMVFWEGICGSGKGEGYNAQPLFLVSKVTEMLLSKYHMVSQSKSMINDEKYIINDIKKNGKIKDSILSTLKMLIRRVFENNSLEAFIFSHSSWDHYKPILYDITSTASNECPELTNETRKKLELISYRNESLRIRKPLVPAENGGEDTEPSGSNILKLRSVDIDLTAKLDDNPVDFDWASYLDRNMLHVTQIRQLFFWAIHPSRTTHYEANQLVAKIILLKINTVEAFQEYAVEDVIWSLVFQLAKLDRSTRSMTVALPSMYRLLNILITYGILKVPAYIRKLISSGILYLPESNDKLVHCDVLINLKISPLMKSQYNMVLRNVMEYDPSYFEKYNFDILLEKAESLKQVISGKENPDMGEYPLNIKIMTAEWYLTRICSGGPTSVDKSTLIKNFQIFCVRLDATHYFYKWIEFIVYHQLLDSIEALEALMDIMLCFGKLFSQFINDHILFTKTFILIYTKDLKNKDPNAYAVTSFMPFWKFFIKNFSSALNIDEDLRTELSAVYEEEKAKVERLGKNKQDALNVYLALNEQALKNVSWNFTEIFQTSLRGFLEGKDIASQRRPRDNLLLLMSTNIKEYNKFMSIFLKRKAFKRENLLNLIASKLLTFEQVQNVLDLATVLNLLPIDSTEHGLYFEYHKEQYILNNFKTVLVACQKDFSHYYGTFLDVLLKYGTRSKFASVSNKMIATVLKNNPVTHNQILQDMLLYGVSKEEEDDDSTIDEPKAAALYSMLNFTNLWIFQAYTNYQVELISNSDASSLGTFLFEVLDYSSLNCLCAHIFDEIANPQVLLAIIQIFEHNFFERCKFDSDSNKTYMNVVIEIITSLSQKLQGDVNISDHSFELLSRAFDQFTLLDEESLTAVELQFEITLKIFTIHQNSIFQRIVSSIENRGHDGAGRLIEGTFKLFDETTSNLRLKLMLYELLSSMKSYCIYASTTTTKFNTPAKLLNLPPFQISSFIRKTGKTDADEKADLGLQTIDPKTEDGSDRWFLFDKKESSYVCKLHCEPYHLINNYQSEGISSFNNSCLNLSLFNACFEKKNPS